MQSALEAELRDVLIAESDSAQPYDGKRRRSYLNRIYDSVGIKRNAGRTSKLASVDGNQRRVRIAVSHSISRLFALQGRKPEIYTCGRHSVQYLENLKEHCIFVKMTSLYV